ncbi:nucleic acid/nucleotide deaminase domain-containing protein, partial [Pseudomonas sp. 5S4]
VCASPHDPLKILVTSNPSTFNRVEYKFTEQNISVVMANLLNDEKPSVEENNVNRKIYNKRETDLDPEVRYWRYIYDIDNFYGSAIHNKLKSSSNIFLVKGDSPNVHAELRLLEWMESNNEVLPPRLEEEEEKKENEARNPQKTPINIGVSLRCCGKCSAFIAKYRVSKNGKYLPFVRGSHGVFDLSGWELPDTLSELTGTLGIALKFFERTSQESGKSQMTHDASDTEDD